MTCREKLTIEHPHSVDVGFMGGCANCPSDFFEISIPDYCSCDEETCTKCWDRELSATEQTEPTEDLVNHPNHYTNGGMECIEEMLLIFGIEWVMHFCLLNAWKYRYRALDKNGRQDMDKSHWYIVKYKELKERLKEQYGEPNPADYYI